MTIDRANILNLLIWKIIILREVKFYATSVNNYFAKVFVLNADTIRYESPVFIIDIYLFVYYECNLYFLLLITMPTVTLDCISCKFSPNNWLLRCKWYYLYKRRHFIFKKRILGELGEGLGTYW